MEATHYDAIVIGSGFGGSVSALRLTEKGYRVLVLEKGKRFTREDFPKTNWDLRRWLWMPELSMHGIFKMTFFEHVTIFSGVGVGGGSLVYANTLPVPKVEFFRTGSWAGLATGKPSSPRITRRRSACSEQPPTRASRQGDEVLRDIARDMGREKDFGPTDVAVFFGTPGKTVPDPYFDGAGPERTGCTHCGACMTGCRWGQRTRSTGTTSTSPRSEGSRCRPRRRRPRSVHAVRGLHCGGPERPWHAQDAPRVHRRQGVLRRRRARDDRPPAQDAVRP